MRNINTFLIFVVIRIIENIFRMLPNSRINTRNMVGAILGLGILTIILYVTGKTNESIGIVLNKYKILKGLVVSWFVSITPILVGLIFDLMSMKLLSLRSPEGGYNIDFSVYAYGTRFSGGSFGTYLSRIALCAFITLLAALFYEMLFRGYLLSQSRRIMPFYAANLFQGTLYGLWCAIIPILGALVGIASIASMGTTYAVKLILLYFLHGLLGGLAYGLCVKASGAIWLSMFSNFILAFSMNIIHTTSDSGMGLFEMRRCVVTDACFLVFAFIFYAYKKKKHNGIREKINAADEATASIAEAQAEKYYDSENELERTVKESNQKYKSAFDKFDATDVARKKKK